MKDVYSIYPEIRNKLDLALEQESQEKAKHREQELQKQLKIARQEKQQKEEQDDLETSEKTDDLRTSEKTVEHYEPAIRRNFGLVLLAAIIFVVSMVIFTSFRKQRDRRRDRGARS